uniref:Nucleolar protein 8 n=1 Tax=Panagrolaimus superbus TaxID=310955 RepID=A0A914YQM8_9BILA
MVDVNYKSAKHAASQEKRLQSLREKQKLQKQKQKLVSEALKAVDNAGAKNNKRIVFESDSEEESTVAKKPKLTSKRLFEDSDDEEPDLEKQDPDTLISTGRLTGKGSNTLMQLEKTYGFDNRFQLDKSFLEDNEKEEDADIQRAQEKDRQLRLLSMVVGRDVKARQETIIKKSNVRPFQRFDPDNPEHVEWMKNFSKEQKLDIEIEDEKKMDDEQHEPSTVESAKPIVDERRFYSIDQDFAAELRAKLVSGQKETFSLLTKQKKFGSDDEDEEKMKHEKKITSDVELKKKPEINIQRTATEPCFFFEITDARLTSKIFYATVENDARLKKWSKARDAFKKVSRQVHKHRMREIDIKKK